MSMWWRIEVTPTRSTLDRFCTLGEGDASFMEYCVECMRHRWRFGVSWWRNEEDAYRGFTDPSDDGPDVLP